MEIKITFSKSRSAVFVQVVKECRKFQGFTKEEDRYALNTTYQEAMQRWDAYQVILLNAINWASFEYRHAGELVTDKARIKKSFYMMQSIVQCMKEHLEVIEKERFCRATIWGCRMLDSVHIFPDFYDRQRGWFMFGYLEDGVWKIDKEKMLRTMLEEANMKHLSSCPNFVPERLAQAVHALPAFIDIATKEWKLTTSVQLIDGEFKTVCNGIEWVGSYQDYKPTEILLKALNRL